MRAVRCGNCGAQPKFLKREKLQLGQTGFFSGDWGNILAGALEVEIYCCPRCGKIEFYQPKEHMLPAEGTQEDLPPREHPGHRGRQPGRRSPGAVPGLRQDP